MKRSISLFIAILMVLSVLTVTPFTVSAEETEADVFGFAGYQVGDSALRLIGYTDSLEYDSIGFYVSVTGDAVKEKQLYTENVFSSLKSGDEVVAATEASGIEATYVIEHAYLYGYAIVNIADGEYVMEVLPVAKTGDEVTEGAAYTLSVVVEDGVVTAEKYVETPVATKQVFVKGNKITTNGNLSQIAKIFDNSLSEKMCEFDTRPLEITWELDQAETLVEYVLISGEDQPVRDPKSWTLYGSADGNEWAVLDTQSNEAPFAERNGTYTYTLDNDTAYQFYKWVIDANFGTDPWGNDILQLQELQLFVLDVPTDAVETQVEINFDSVKSDAGIEGGQGIGQLFDNNLDSKACIVNVTSLWVSVELKKPAAVNMYKIGSANDHDPRDPKSWVLYGSNDGEAWVELDTRTDEDLPARNMLYSFYFENTTEYGFYKLKVLSNCGKDAVGLDVVQFSEWQLFVSGAEVAKETKVPVNTDTIQSDAGIEGGQGIGQLFDNSLDTKACIVNVTSLWVSVQLEEAAAVNMYKIGSANDHDPRDPKDWVLYGSNDGTTWVALDTRTDEDMPARNMLYSYSFENTTAYSYYKLEVLSNCGKDAVGLDVVQFSEWQLFMA